MENDTLYFEANRSLWNQKTPVHLRSEFYNMPAFMAGKTSLNQIELAEVGPVNGKSMLHLQCHFGQDSLSWARMGAKVTGIDISDEAIKQARELNSQLSLDATFVRSNLYDLKENLEGQFDIVFTSYGTIGWLPDLDKWADIIDHFLKPGGTFYIAEFHPVLWMFDDNFSEIVYPYHNTHEPIITETEGTYADREAPIKQKEYGWNHGLGEVITALISRGIYPEFLHEFSYSPYNCFSGMVQGEDGYWRIKGLENKLPMVYSIKAIKRGN
ncbi:class I SAM-dependent methyltransferase [Pontibacter cellulosilyticus]|uniref:Class I SAM-dependent methyltransferase n=1 Tax=Pontibacter cellulosilyticus TaxID=1720253 RepID=A0A923N4D0_9BACT|nr:class I SAM-dependent methyltransferase [Pontibacter cellulosilyticus]MBC5992670.1 class I SAM-dependent methyltransferase [Pontibacter cellulosilyticus]